MNTKSFNLLAIAAVVSLVTAGLVHSAYDTWNVENVSGEKLFPGFDRDANQVGQLAIQQGEKKLEFHKAKGNWTIANRGGYPAKTESVQQLLVRIARAELVEAKTKDPERYGLLELEDPSGKDAQSKLIGLRDANGKTIGELVVGKRRQSAFGQGRSGVYVRRPGNDQTWLSNVTIQPTFDVSDWVEPVFFRIGDAKVKTLTLQTPDGGEVQIVADESKKDDKKEDVYKFATIPDGKQLKKDVDASVIVRGLQTFELTDVRKRADAKLPKDAITIPAVIEMEKGMKLQAELVRIGEDDRWLSLKVLEDGKDAKAAKSFREKLDGWQFKIADWRARQVFKTSGEMFEDKPKEAAATTSEDATKQPAVPGPVVPKANN